MRVSVERGRLPILLLLAGMVLTAAVYWIGLYGPFLFDDGPNFSIIKAWLDGKASLERVVFGNRSWLTNRSLAMGSFALNALLLGYSPFSFKLVNLFLHLICGAVAYQLFVLLLARDPQMQTRARLAAAGIVIVWLLHPFNVSTVLYAVQRMTQLATLLCLLGLWAYAWVRTRQQAHGLRHGWLLLFLSIPLLTMVGIQGKQNAAVLPLLCLVVEVAFFLRPREWPRPLTAFYVLLLAVPAVALGVGFAIRPEALLAGYNEYPFSLGQRLLSEGRVLCDYLRMLLLPYPPGMGVYTDDYTHSSALFSPPWTAVAIALLATISVGAWKVRTKLPTVFAGWFLFLAAHTVESTILPIELYYEHRNYLPALGLFLCCAGLIAAFGRFLAGNGIRIGRVGATIAIAVCLVLALQTHGRARVWSDVYTLAESALENHPDSSRATLNYVGLALESGDTARAYEVINQTIATSNDPKLRGLARLFRIRMECQLRGAASSGELAEAISELPPHVDLTMVQIMGYTRHLIERKEGCRGITKSQFADAIVATVDRAELQPDKAWAKWMLRYRAAELYAADGDWARALPQAELAWQPGVDIPVSALLVDAYLHRDRVSDAERIYRQAAARIAVPTSEDRVGLRNMQGKIESAKAERSQVR